MNFQKMTSYKINISLKNFLVGNKDKRTCNQINSSKVIEYRTVLITCYIDRTSWLLYSVRGANNLNKWRIRHLILN